MSLDPVSRRAFLATSGGLLASLTLPSIQSLQATAAPDSAAAAPTAAADLAR